MDFYANRNELALKYCVNRNKPMLHCNGHCFLLKVLKKEEQQEKALGDAFSKIEVMVCQNRFPKINVANNYTVIESTQKITPTDSHIWQLFIVNRLLKPPAA